MCNARVHFRELNDILKLSMKNFLYPSRLKFFIWFLLVLYVTLSAVFVTSLNASRSLGPQEYSTTQIVFSYLAMPGSFLGVPFFFCINTFHNVAAGFMLEVLFLYIFSCFVVRKKTTGLFTAERMKLFFIFLAVAIIGFSISRIVIGHLSIGNYVSLNHLRDIGLFSKNIFLYVYTPLDFLLQNLPNILLAFLTGIFLAKKFIILQKRVFLFFVFLTLVNPVALLLNAIILSSQIQFSVILFLIMLPVSAFSMPIWGLIGYRLGGNLSSRCKASGT